jgi:hypothetical protein
MRYLAGAISLPPALASRFTVGNSRVLRIVGDECRANGTCSLHLDAIAARAGVCRSTVRNALREARRLGLITLQERRRFGEPSLTNIVRIVSSEWKLWLRSVENSGPPVGSADAETPTNRALESEAGLAISRARYDNAQNLSHFQD